MASHSHRLLHICHEANPVKEAYKDAKCLLQPLRLGQGNNSIVSIKLRCQFLYR